MTIVSTKLTDGGTVEIPSDPDELSIDLHTSGFATSVFLVAVGNGDLTEYDVSIVDVDGDDDIDVSEYDYVESAHNRYQNWTIVGFRGGE